MSEEEKLHFESLMAEDTQLREDTKKMRTFLADLKTEAEPATDETYFINMLPEFYARRNKKKKFVFTRIAYSLSTAAAVLLVIFLVFKPFSSNNYTNMSELSQNLTESELNTAINEYADQYSTNDLISSVPVSADSVVNNMFANALDLSTSVDKTLADNYLSNDELLSSINETEANELYSQLINVDIIKGAK